MQQVLGRELKYIPFHEGKPYSEEDIKTRIRECLGSDCEDIEDIFEKIIGLKFTKKSHKKIQFDFVGISPIRTGDLNESIANAVIAVYPKWRHFDYDAEWPSWFFNQYFFSSLRSYHRDVETTTLLKENIGADFRIYGSKAAHFLDCMYAFVVDVNRFGIIHEKQHVEHLRKGKANWKKTFNKGKVMISGNTPYYLEPIRTKKSKLYNEISQIHQEAFAHSMTILSQYIPSIHTKISWQEKLILPQVPRKIYAVKQALRSAKVQKQRDRLNNLLMLLEAKAVHSDNTEEIVGISSKGFNGLWEHALLRVIGDKVKTDRINELICKKYPVDILVNGGVWDKSVQKRHIIDGLVFTANEELVIIDAKNYGNWKRLGIEDIVKQYAYEKLVTHISSDNDGSWDEKFPYLEFDYLRNTEIKANIFVFPLNTIPGKEQTAEQDGVEKIKFLGKYRINYLAELATSGDLIAVGVNPDTLFKQYKEGGKGLHHEFVRFLSEDIPTDEAEIIEGLDTAVASA